MAGARLRRTLRGETRYPLPSWAASYPLPSWAPFVSTLGLAPNAMKHANPLVGSQDDAIITSPQDPREASPRTCLPRSTHLMYSHSTRPAHVQSWALAPFHCMHSRLPIASRHAPSPSCLASRDKSGLAQKAGARSKRTRCGSAQKRELNMSLLTVYGPCCFVDSFTRNPLP